MSDVPGDVRQARQKLLAGVVVITTITFLAYLPALPGGFVMDDDLYLSNSPLIKASDGEWHQLKLEVFA